MKYVTVMNDFTNALYILLRCVLYPFELLRGSGSGGIDGVYIFGALAVGVAFGAGYIIGRRYG